MDKKKLISKNTFEKIYVRSFKIASFHAEVAGGSLCKCVIKISKFLFGGGVDFKINYIIEFEWMLNRIVHTTLKVCFTFSR